LLLFILACFVGEERVMKMDLRYAWDTANTRSSMLGCDAAVMAMVSPSQPSPAVIQRMSISVQISVVG
jgi:hypothetical protein